MLRNTLFAITVLIALLAGVGLLLPRDVHVERSVTIRAAPEQVFAYVNDFHTFNEWSPWAARDLDAVYTFSGPPAGMGARMSWAGNDRVGNGSQEITLSEPSSRIEVTLDFGPDGIVVAFFTFEEVGEGTEVTWGFDTDMGFNPVNRYFGLMMDFIIGADYAEGLLNLRNLVEDQTSVMRMPDGTPMDPNDMDPNVMDPNVMDPNDMDASGMGSAPTTPPSAASQDAKPGDGPPVKPGDKTD